LVSRGIQSLIIRMSGVLNIILSHQPRLELDRVLSWWSSYARRENILVAYGGTELEFNSLSDVQRIFVPDPRLRVRDLQREKQSYGGIFRAAAHWLAEHDDPFTHVYFAEFDHVPIVPDFTARLLERIKMDNADVLAHGLHRVDGTSNVHYLYHLADPAFLNFWRRISIRAEKEAVLKFVATGSLWTREAFLAVAAQKEEVAGYLEVYLPTVAHHLGFRVRGFREQDQCVSTMPIKDLSLERARAMGCWTVHPVKTLPVAAVG
jgi:hypothetical protein